MFHEKEFRFLFYEEEKQIIWRTISYVEKRDFFEENFDNLTHEEIKMLYQYTKKLYDYVRQFPSYRVKITTGAVEIKESCSLFETYESLTKEGN